MVERAPGHGDGAQVVDAAAIVVAAAAIDDGGVVRDGASVDGDKTAAAIDDTAAPGGRFILPDVPLVDDEGPVIVNGAPLVCIASLDGAYVSGIFDGELAAADDLEHMPVSSGLAQAAVQRAAVQVQGDRLVVMDLHLRGNVDVGHQAGDGPVQHHRLPQLRFIVHVNGVLGGREDDMHVNVVAMGARIQVVPVGRIAVRSDRKSLCRVERDAGHGPGGRKGVFGVVQIDVGAVRPGVQVGGAVRRHVIIGASAVGDAVRTPFSRFYVETCDGRAGTPLTVLRLVEKVDVLASGTGIQVLADHRPPLRRVGRISTLVFAGDSHHVGDETLRPRPFRHAEEQGRHPDYASFQGIHPSVFFLVCC